MDELKIITRNKSLTTNNKNLVANRSMLEKSIETDSYSPISYNLHLYKDIKAHESDILCLTAYKNFIITGSNDKNIQIRDIDTGKLISTLSGHTGAVYSLAIWDNKLISGSSDKTLRIWDIESARLLTTILAHQNQIYSLSCQDNFLISSSLDKTIKIWNLEVKKILKIINLEISAWNICIYQNKIFAGFSDGSLRVYNLSNGSLLISQKEHSDAITSLKINNNNVYTSSKDKTIKIWDSESLNVLKTINTNSIVWSVMPDKDYLFFGGDDKSLRVWSIKDKKIVQNANSHHDWISAIDHHKSRIVSVSADSTIKIWSKKPVNTCETIDLNIKSLEKSPFETNDEYNERKRKNYLELAQKIINYDYINIGYAVLQVNNYDFENNSLPLTVNISCEKVIKLSNLEKQFVSTITITKDEAKLLYENNNSDLYIKYYLENNSLKYEFSLIFLDNKYIISQNIKKVELLTEQKKDLKQDRLDIKINKPEKTSVPVMFNPEYDCNTIVLSDTFRKPFEDYNDFETRVKKKLIDYKYINCGKVELLADKYSIDDEKFPMKTIFTCDKLLNIISLIPDGAVTSQSNSKQLVPLKKYEFFSCIIIDRHQAKEMYENSKSSNLYINFIEKDKKLFFELFIIFKDQRYFIM